MPAKYMIHTQPIPNRFEAITKSGIIAWEEGCLKCAVCVKKQCVYQVYDNRGLDSGQMIESIDNQCMNCFRCVQNCPKQLIHKSSNPEFKALGDGHWSPDIIAKLWYQAETGKIPVSGAGYPGPFIGPGFDAMWTDMSEIVRPTRDGIHGREYISTAVDLGRTPRHLVFNDSGELENGLSSLMDIPLPIIMRVPGFGSLSRKTLEGWAMAAKHLGTLLVIPDQMIKKGMEDFGPQMIPLFAAGPIDPFKLNENTRVVEIPWQENWKAIVDEIKNSRPGVMISIRLPLEKGVEEKALNLVDAGVYIIHLEAAQNGLALDDHSRFLKDGIRSLHLALVEAGTRDEITLLASGGISMAEHVAKSMICGADAVYVDFPVLIALECRMCRRCTKGLSCPVRIEEADPAWVESRVINLIGAWHNQLLEVMGAMGIRDARRLRGESGRAMFFEELDETTFGSLGNVQEGCELE
ncbi:glutamate synthase-related protein [Thermodesulfobacteriota bacterium]